MSYDFYPDNEIDMYTIYPISSITHEHFIVNNNALSYIYKYKCPNDNLYKFSLEDECMNIEYKFSDLQYKLNLFFTDTHRFQTFYETIKDLELKSIMSDDNEERLYYSKIIEKALLYRQKSIRSFGFTIPNSIN